MTRERVAARSPIACLAALSMLWAAGAGAAVYEYEGVFTLCISACDSFSALGEPGGTINPTPSVVTGTITIDVEPGGSFETADLVDFDFEVFNAAAPVVPYDGTNITLANPLPLSSDVAVVIAGFYTANPGGDFQNPTINPVTATVEDCTASLVPVNGTCTITVEFSPDDDIEYSGTLNVISNAQTSPVVVTIFGAVDSPDSDGDGVVDTADNCVLTANANQRNTNGDGIGNICGADLNGDGIVGTIDLGLLKVMFFRPPGPSGMTKVCARHVAFSVQKSCS